MSLDAYGPCPGGTGRKVKFCPCRHDLLGELEKLARLEQSDQPSACLSRCEHLLGRHPDRPCLFAFKTRSEIQLREWEAARQTSNAFLDQFPENPLARTNLAITSALLDDPAQAILEFYSAAEHAEGEQIGMLVPAIAPLGIRLAEHGRLAPAMHFLVLAQSLRGEESSYELSILMELLGSSTVPLALKEEPQIGACPEDAPYREAFEAASQAARQLRWNSACEQFTELSAKWPQVADPWRGLAIAREWIAEEKKAAAAWREFARKSNSSEDVVTALLRAEALDEEDTVNGVEAVKLTSEFSDMDRCEELLAAERRIRRMELPSPDEEEDTEPRPRLAFELFDRPIPREEEPVNAETVPQHVATVFLYGRQTDREPRLVVHAVKWRDRADRAKQFLEELLSHIVAEGAAPETQEEIAGKLSPLSLLLNTFREFPPHADWEARLALAVEDLKTNLHDVLPGVRFRILGHRTPDQAAQSSDPFAQRALEALLTLIELALPPQHAAQIDFDEIRRAHNWPEAPNNAPEDGKVPPVPLPSLLRVDVGKLSDDELTSLFESAMSVAFHALSRRVAGEIIRRPQLETRPGIMPLVHLSLAESESELEPALEWLAKAKAGVERGSRLHASISLHEMRRRAESGDAENFQRLIKEFVENHQHDTEAMGMLQDLLVKMGMIRMQPDGSMEGVTAEMSEQAPSAAAPQENRVWTPDQERAESGRPAAIWTPGSD